MQLRSHRHADGNRFAMQELMVAGFGLDRVADGMTEIENGAQPSFALILCNHLSLDAARGFHHFSQHCRIQSEQLLTFLRKKGKKTLRPR